MTRDSIFNYKFTNFSVSKSFTDAMWRWSMTIPRGYPVPDTWEPIDAISPDSQNCILLGFPLTKKNTTSYDFKGVTVSGFSYGWYVANRPIRPENRLLSSTIQGTNIIVEDPIGYLSRLIHGDSNICGLMKGGWDASVPGWGSADLPYQQFESTDTSTVQHVLDDICEYGGLVYQDYWKKIGNIWQPVSYLRSESLLDSGFDLPPQITISSSSLDVRTNRVFVDTDSEINGEKWYNSVWVDGVVQGSMSGYSARRPASWAAGMEIERPYQYCYSLPPTVSSSQAQALIAKKCNDFYSLLTLPTETFRVKFFSRYDLKLLQRIRFTGFENIPDTPMRIIEISYEIDRDGGCVCSCSCASDRSWSAARKLNLIMKQDWLKISDSVQRAVDRKKSQVVYGTLISTGSANSGVFQKAGSGAYAYTSLPNQ